MDNKNKMRRKSVRSLASSEMDTIAEDEEMKSPTGRRSRRQTIMSKDSDDNLLAPPAGSGRKQSVYNMGMSFKAMNVTRRLSMRPEGLGSVEAFRKQRKQIRYENTYKMEPEEGETFIPYKVRDIVEEVLRESLEGVSYDPVECSSLTGELSDRIKMEVKDLIMPRYKIVVHVILGQKMGQAFQAASRCVWDHELDNCVSVTHETTALFATATVYGICFD